MPKPKKEFDTETWMKTFEENQKTLQWLKTLQQNLVANKTSENKKTDILYYGILDYHPEQTTPGNEDTILLHNNETGQNETIEDTISRLDPDQQKDLYEDGIIVKQNGEWQILSQNEYLEFIQDILGYTPVYITYTGFIAQNAIFMTRTEAEKYLNENRHLYTKDAITFAMTMPDDSQYGQLIKLLQKINFDETKIVLHKTP